MKFPLAAQTYISGSRPLSVQSLINLYPEKAPPDARVPFFLKSTPGQKLFTTIGTGPIRGLKTMKGVLYAVSGTKLFKVASASGATELGDVGGTGPVMIEGNGHQLAVLSSKVLFVYNVQTENFDQVTDPDFPGALTMTWLDGFNIFSFPDDSGQWGYSAIYDATDYDALDYATAEALPDRLIRIINHKRLLYLMGWESVEVWYNSGAADLPFERIGSGVVEYGCYAPHSVAKLDDGLFFLASDGEVKRLDGMAATRISTHAIETAIEGYRAPDEATAFAYTSQGHKFYVLNFEEATWVYDASIDLWHQRQTYLKKRWEVDHYTFAYRKHLVGDIANGNIYELDHETYTDNGNVIVREAVSPPLQSVTDQPETYANLELDMETGVGLPEGQGANPKIVLTYSKDSGRTWSNDWETNIGKQGEYFHRAKWQGSLGSADVMVLRVRISDPVPISIYAVKAE